MNLKRMMPFLLITIIATGCFRQARDTFDTVDSTGGQGISITQESQTVPEIIQPTDDITFIDPNANNNNSEPTAIVIEAATNTPFPTTEPITGGNTSGATPTIIIIQSTNTNALPTLANQSVLATATSAQQFITPDVPLELIESTATATLPVTQSALDTASVDSSTTSEEDAPLTVCEYQIQSGDTLFQIALRNDTTVEEIQTANGISGDVIQPGDVLILPDCVDDGTPRPTNTPSPTNTPRPDGELIHIVRSGDTLYDIAIRYGTTITAIREANDLANNIIRPGQELIIPDQDVQPTSPASSSSGAGNVPTATRVIGG